MRSTDKYQLKLITMALSLTCGYAGQAHAIAADYVPIPSGVLSSVLSGGSNKNADVRIAEFSLRSEPVTVAEFARFTELHPEWQRNQIPSIFADASYLQQLGNSIQLSTSAQHAITNVSWFAAQAYCESESARLPTWYEWEYVAAADAHQADARKNAAWRAKILGWYSQPSSTAQYNIGGELNFYGVRDMHGLIWEWVDDFNALLVSADSRNQGDPEQLQYCGAGAISLQDRENFAILMRVALLSSLNGADTTKNLGFRCAKNTLKGK